MSKLFLLSNGKFIVIKNNSKNIGFTTATPSVFRLEAPTVTLTGDFLNIKDNSDKATAFDIYSDGEYQTNVAKVTKTSE